MNLVKRWGAFAVAVAAIVVGIAQPAAADDADTCDASACHKTPPRCWAPERVALRIQVNRAVVVSCNNVTSARLTSPPAHVSITDVSTDWRGLHFRALPDDDAPRFDAATFEVENAYGTAEVQLSIEVIPRSENHAPTCWVPDVSLRTDGTEPATVTPWPIASDPFAAPISLVRGKLNDAELLPWTATLIDCSVDAVILPGKRNVLPRKSRTNGVAGRK